jgi:hypothetical protein
VLSNVEKSPNWFNAIIVAQHQIEGFIIILPNQKFLAVLYIRPSHVTIVGVHYLNFKNKNVKDKNADIWMRKKCAKNMNRKFTKEVILNSKMWSEPAVNVTHNKWNSRSNNSLSYYQAFKTALTSSMHSTIGHLNMLTYHKSSLR